MKCSIKYCNKFDIEKSLQFYFDSFIRLGRFWQKYSTRSIRNGSFRRLCLSATSRMLWIRNFSFTRKIVPRQVFISIKFISLKLLAKFFFNFPELTIKYFLSGCSVYFSGVDIFTTHNNRFTRGNGIRLQIPVYFFQQSIM